MVSQNLPKREAVLANYREKRRQYWAVTMISITKSISL